MSGIALRIVAFGVVVISTFMSLGTYLFELSGGAGFQAASGEVSIEAGQQIFLGKGKCSTCHSIGDEGSAVRCPNFGVKPPQFTEPVGLRAAKRKPSLGAVEYLVESVYEPGAFLVPGFPAGVMTPIHRPPIALSDDEIRSVLLYLLDKSGVETGPETVQALASAQRRFAGRASAAPSGPVVALKLPEGEAEAGLGTYRTMQCFKCHKVQGLDLPVDQLPGNVGPELTGIGAIQTEHYLLESILNPSAVILPNPSPEQKYSEDGKSSKMPSYGSVMTFQQALDVVAFLKSLSEAPKPEAARPVPTEAAGAVP